jgi:hypothetical protein
MKDFFKDLKNQIVAGVGVILTALGTFFLDTVKEKLGLADEEAETTEQVQGVSQEVNVAGPEIIINIPEQQPVKEKVIVKEVPAKPKKTETEKRKDEGLDW